MVFSYIQGAVVPVPPFRQQVAFCTANTWCQTVVTGVPDLNPVLSLSLQLLQYNVPACAA